MIIKIFDTIDTFDEFNEFDNLMGSVSTLFSLNLFRKLSLQNAAFEVTKICILLCIT